MAEEEGRWKHWPGMHNIADRQRDRFLDEPAAELGLETRAPPLCPTSLQGQASGAHPEAAPAPWPTASRHPREVSHRAAISGKYQLLIKNRRWSGPCCFPSRN